MVWRNLHSPATNHTSAARCNGLSHLQAMREIMPTCNVQCHLKPRGWRVNPNQQVCLHATNNCVYCQRCTEHTNTVKVMRHNPYPRATPFNMNKATSWPNIEENCGEQTPMLSHKARTQRNSSNPHRHTCLARAAEWTIKRMIKIETSTAPDGHRQKREKLQYLHNGNSASTTKYPCKHQVQEPSMRTHAKTSTISQSEFGSEVHVLAVAIVADSLPMRRCLDVCLAKCERPGGGEARLWELQGVEAPSSDAARLLCVVESFGTRVLEAMAGANVLTIVELTFLPLR